MPVDAMPELIQDTDPQFYRRWFEALLQIVPATVAICITRQSVGSSLVRCSSLSANRLTFHEYDVEWAAVRRVLESGTRRNAAGRGFDTRVGLSSLVPMALREVIVVDERRVLSLVLDDHDGPCGLVLLVRPPSGEPFCDEHCQLFGSLGPLLSLSLSQHWLTFDKPASGPERHTSDPGFDLDGPTSMLSPQERKIATLLTDGYAVTNIAVITGLTEHTVRTYIRRIYKKLGVYSRADLVRFLLTAQRHAG